MREKNLASLGEGFNTLKNKPVVDVLKIEKKVHFKKIRRRKPENDIVIITDHNVLRKELGVHFDFEVDAPLAGGSLSGAYTKKALSGDDKAFLLMKCSYVHYIKKMQKVEFSDAIQTAGEQPVPAAWIERCGDQYVSQVDIGKKLFALIQISRHKVISSEMVQGALEASIKEASGILKGSAKIDVKKLIDTLKEHQVFSIKIDGVGLDEDFPKELASLDALLEYAKKFSESSEDSYSQIHYHLAPYSGHAPANVRPLLDSINALSSTMLDLRFLQQKLGAIKKKLEKINENSERYIFENDQRSRVTDNLALFYDLNAELSKIILKGTQYSVLTDKQQSEFPRIADEARLAVHAFLSDLVFIRGIKKIVKRDIISDSKPGRDHWYKPGRVRSSDAFSLKATEKYFHFDVRSDVDDVTQIKFNLVKKEPDTKHAIRIFEDLTHKSKRKLDNNQFRELKEKSVPLYIGKPRGATSTFMVDISKTGFFESAQHDNTFTTSPRRISELKESTARLFDQPKIKPKKKHQKKKSEHVEEQPGFLPKLPEPDEQSLFSPAPENSPKLLAVTEPLPEKKKHDNVPVKSASTGKNSRFFSDSRDEHSSRANSPYIPPKKKEVLSHGEKRGRDGDVIVPVEENASHRKPFRGHG